MERCRKESFSTPEAAYRQMQRVRASGKVIGESANVYQCAACGKFHWGRRDIGDKAIADATNAHRVAVWPPRRRSA